MEPFSAQGWWWLPGAENEKLPGTLSYSPQQGTRLDLLNRFGGGFGLGPDPDQEPWSSPIVLGVIPRHNVTLVDTFEAPSFTLSMPGYPTQTLNVATILRGGHLDERARFGDATLRVSHLEEWSNFSPFEERITLEGSPAPSAVRSHTIHFHPPDSHVAHLDGDVTVELFPTGSHQRSRFERSIVLSAAFGIDLPERLDLDEIVARFVRPLQELLTLASDDAAAVLELSVADPSIGDQALRFEVGRRWPFAPETIDSSPYMLFRVGEFDFARRLPVGFRLADRLREVMGLLFGIRYRRGFTTEALVLDATTAAEAMHREMVKEKRKPLDLDSPGVQVLLEEFPTDERPLLCERLRHANDTRLYDRLLELVSLAGSAVDTLVRDPEKWANLAKKARNDLAHRAGRPPRNRLPSEAQYAVAHSVAHVMTVYLLRLLEFSEPEITHMMSGSRRAGWAEELARQYLAGHFPD